MFKPSTQVRRGKRLDPAPHRSASAISSAEAGHPQPRPPQQIRTHHGVGHLKVAAGAGPTHLEVIMKSKYGRTIHPSRLSGHNPRPTPPQAVAPQAPAAHRVPQRPEDARTLREAADGMLAAMAKVHFVIPRFPDTTGSWIRLGQHETRVPANSITSIRTAATGREFAIVAGTLSNDGMLWLLTDRPEGVREVTNLPDGYRDDLRRAAFGLD